MSMIDEIDDSIKAYTDYLTDLGLGYNLQKNNTSTSYSLSVSGSLTAIRGIVATTVSSGVALDTIVLTKGYTGFTSLNITLNPISGSGSLRSEFSYARV